MDRPSSLAGRQATLQQPRRKIRVGTSGARTTMRPHPDWVWGPAKPAAGLRAESVVIIGPWSDVKGCRVPLFLSRCAIAGSSGRIVLARRTFRRRVLNPMVIVRQGFAGEPAQAFAACLHDAQMPQWTDRAQGPAFPEESRIREKVQPFFYTVDCAKACSLALPSGPWFLPQRRMVRRFQMQGCGPTSCLLDRQPARIIAG